MLVELVAHRSGFTSLVADCNQEGCLTQAYRVSLRAVGKCHFLHTARATAFRRVARVQLLHFRAI